MATFSLEELIEPSTREEVQASIYSVLATIGLNTTVWKPGAVVRTTILGTSIVLAAMSQLIAKIARSGFLELSEDDWLTLVAHHVYGVDRIEATFATGQVTLTNSGGGVYTLDPDDLIVANSTSGKTYRNTSGFTLGAGLSADVDIRASEVGSASSSGPGAIDSLVSTLLNVTCTNASPVLGRDVEKDPALRARCSEKLGSLSPMGPWDAYAFAVRNAVRADGSSLGITRVRLTKDGYGNVNIYCATDSGGVLGTVGDLNTDLGVADDAVQRGAAPEAVTANTIGATPVAINVTYELWMYNTSGRTNIEVQGLVSARLTEFMAGQPIGGNVISGVGKVYLDAIRAAIASTLTETFHVVVTAPAGDTTLAVNEVPVMTLSPTVTGIHQVPPPEGFGA